MISIGKHYSIQAVMLSFVWLLTSCSQTVLQTPSKTRVHAPPKRIPPTSAVPATQRPYKINGKTYYPIPSSHGFIQTGIASWYGKKFHGRKTSNGETYNMHEVSAAHKTLPMNTYLQVKNLENNREVIVRVNDRGPFVKGRIIDLSYAAAQEVGMADKGTAKVRITALGEAATFGDGKKKMERFLPHQDFSVGDFYVQIGSFTDKNNADRLQNKMVEWGRKAVIQVHETEDNTFYRVQVQAGQNLSKANRTERALVEAGFTDAFVVAR